MRETIAGRGAGVLSSAHGEIYLVWSIYLWSHQRPRKCVWRKTDCIRRRGSAGGRMSANAPGERCARTIAPTAAPGSISPTTMARSKAYRWGEDGLAGVCDRYQLLVFALALWNGRDPILKERLFGLTPGEANHGEDVKEYYFYLDSTPTHSYMKYLYKYPQAEYPYGKLIEKNRRRAATRVRSTNCSTPAFSTRTAISMSSSNTPRRSRKIFASASRCLIAAPRRRRSTFCRTCGSAISGRGDRNADAPSRSSVAGPAGEGRQPCRRRHRRRTAAQPAPSPIRLGPRYLVCRRGRRSPCSPTMRPTRARLWPGRPEPQPLCQGRFPSPHHQRRGLRQPGPDRHQGVRPLRQRHVPAGGSVVFTCG